MSENEDRPEPDVDMLRADAGRYRLLETLRQYGWDRLIQRQQLDAARGRHAERYAAVVEEHRALLRTPGRQTDAMDRLDADYDNVRAALAHLIETGNAEAAARMVVPLITLFNIRHPREGLGRFRAVIAIADDLTPQLRASLLANASSAAYNVGDDRSCHDCAQAAIDIGGAGAPPLALVQLANWHIDNGEPDQAVALGRQAIATAHGNPVVELRAMIAMTNSISSKSDETEFREWVAGFVALAGQVANPTLLATAYAQCGEAFAALGWPAEARSWCEKGLTLADAAGPQLAVYARTAARISDDLNTATELLRVALPIARDHLAGFSQTRNVLPAAKIAHQIGRAHAAATIVGAYQRSATDAGVRGNLRDRDLVDELLLALRDSLGADALAAAIAEGRQLTGDQALQLAIDTLA